MGLRRRNALALVTKAYVWMRWMRYKFRIEQAKRGIAPLTGSMLPALLALPRFRGRPKTERQEPQDRKSTAPKSRPPCPREFREEAVRLARTSGRPTAQIARELGGKLGGPHRLGEAGGARRRTAW